MIRLFKSSNASFTFLLAIILVVVCRLFYANYAMDTSFVNEDLAPLSKAFYKLLGEELSFNRVFHYALSGLLVLLQAYVINSLVLTYKVLPKAGSLVAWIYLLLMHLSPDFLLLSPALLASTLAIFIFKAVVELSFKQKAVVAFFNGGMLVSFAFLLWHPSWILIVLVLWSTFLIAVFQFRYIYLLIIGVLIPIIYLLSYYFLTDQFVIGASRIFSTFSWNVVDFKEFFSFKGLYLVFPLLWTIIGMVYTLAYRQSVVKEIRRFLSLLLLFLLLFIIVFVVYNNGIQLSLIPLIFPAALLITLFINRIKRPLIAELVHLSLLLPIIIQSILAFKA